MPFTITARDRPLTSAPSKNNDLVNVRHPVLDWVQHEDLANSTRGVCVPALHLGLGLEEHQAALSDGLDKNGQIFHHVHLVMAAAAL